MLTGRPGGAAAENLRVVEEKLREEKRRAAAAGNGFQSSLFAAHALEARAPAPGSRAAARRFEVAAPPGASPLSKSWCRVEMDPTLPLLTGRAGRAGDG